MGQHGSEAAGFNWANGLTLDCLQYWPAVMTSAVSWFNFSGGVEKEEERERESWWKGAALNDRNKTVR